MFARSGGAPGQTEECASFATTSSAPLPDETITVPVTEEERFLSDRPSAGGVVKVGQSDWVREEHILTVDMAGQSITLPDPDVVLALVRAGRGALDVLTGIPTREPLR